MSGRPRSLPRAAWWCLTAAALGASACRSAPLAKSASSAEGEGKKSTITATAAARKPAPPAPAAPPAPPAEVPLTPDEEASARQIALSDCGGCHSPAEMLSQQRLTRKQWEKVVKKMRDWGSPLEEGKADLMVRYFSAQYRTDAPPFAVNTIDAAEAAKALAPQPDGRYGKGKAKDGEPSYKKMCGDCHGADGRGSLTGVTLIERPVLYRADEFADVVRTGRGRMPAFNEVTDAEIASIIAYLRTLHSPGPFD